jgi:hypothetical protein
MVGTRVMLVISIVARNSIKTFLMDDSRVVFVSGNSVLTTRQ